MILMIEKYLQKNCVDLNQFWIAGESLPVRSVQDHCDYVYTLHLTGQIDKIESKSVQLFIEHLYEFQFPGWSKNNSIAISKLSVHNFAYLLGTLNLLKKVGYDCFSKLFKDRTFVKGELVDSMSRPIYPKKFTHHNWRVSHWIGGVPSILWSLGQSSLPQASYFASLADDVLIATDSLLSPKTGLIKLYKSQFIQNLFRRLYKLRHDPDLGDLGGVAHILWINHVAKRDYIGIHWLAKEATRLMNLHRPFMEKVPYCLDFDIIQILRTAKVQSAIITKEDVNRAAEMMLDIEIFYQDIPAGYSLHKIPGALATYHECALITGRDIVPTIGTSAKDIILDAFWI